MTTQKRIPEGKIGLNPLLWDNYYNTYIDEIDEQHQHLFKLIRRMYVVVKNQSEQPIQRNVLDELLDYTHYHFNTEEMLMIEYQYPFSEIHKRQHDDFTFCIREFREDFRQGKHGQKQAFKILAFLFNWLIEHISVLDKELANYLNSKGIS